MSSYLCSILNRCLVTNVDSYVCTSALISSVRIVYSGGISTSLQCNEKMSSHSNTSFALQKSINLALAGTHLTIEWACSTMLPEVKLSASLRSIIHLLGDTMDTVIPYLINSVTSTQNSLHSPHILQIASCTSQSVQHQRSTASNTSNSFRTLPIPRFITAVYGTRLLHLGRAM